ncbi:MAG: Demethylmenaquinone methyltransferase [Candidatus Moanabacter tarae]|uniref:Demethylmenaquinone methyltransferase n=1 Tax=Candidatus Moanibacter tarae TaxID=2200854 RepID=A0A2Z4AI64_9BACT|nr:MAG: Demethylmenaquinone methyltransferase [Candidatus Moanabacter tarae]|tara:strand:+ start:13046 stop:13873 length:828 start_codon:yes stop_codon:yes gene_type:complete
MDHSGKPPTGNYPLELRSGEINRLRIQSEALKFDAKTMLDEIGVTKGWHCLDLGCGAGGIMDLLSTSVCDIGYVVGLDSNPKLLNAAKEWTATLGLKNTGFIRGDAYATRLPEESFDLVHIRFLLGTAGEPERLVKEAKRLTRKGGVIAIQEPDSSMLGCFPRHPAFDRLKQLLIKCFADVGADLKLGKKAYHLISAEGLTDVTYRPFILGFRNSDPMADYLPQTIESIRNTLISRSIASGEEIDRLIDECRNHLASPTTVSNSFLVAQVWGWKK